MRHIPGTGGEWGRWPCRARAASSAGRRCCACLRACDWIWAARRSRGWRSGRGACLDGDGFVNAGGDVQLRQSAPFTVEVERPGGGALYLNLPPGEWGVATSSTLRRAWAGGHHLIDPATGRPLVSRFVQVTAVAPRVTRAEVLTKLAFLDEARLDALLGGAQVVAFEEGGRMLERTGGRWLECENN